MVLYGCEVLISFLTSIIAFWTISDQQPREKRNILSKLNFLENSLVLRANGEKCAQNLYGENKNFGHNSNNL